MAGKTTPKVASETLDQFLAGLSKNAESNTEPGSQDGGSSHPTADAEDNTQTAPEGEQSKDNSKAVKEMVGPAAVDSAKDNGSKVGRQLKVSKVITQKKADVGDAGTAADDQLQIGTNKTPTGEDPSKETGMATPGYPDPGTSHPAAVDNGELDGAKYAKANFWDIVGDFEKEANSYFNDFSNLEVAPAGNKTAAVSTGTAAKAGAAAADAVIDSNELTQKQAYEIAHEQIKVAVYQGMQDGDLVADYFDQLTTNAAVKKAAARKRANELPGAMMDPAAGGGMPPMGGEEMPADPAMGGDPMGGGAEMGGEMGGAEGGTPSPEVMEQVMAVLEQLGVTPEMLSGGGEGGPEAGGEMGGEEGGGAPPAPPEPKTANLQQTKRALFELMTRKAAGAQGKKKVAAAAPRRTK